MTLRTAIESAVAEAMVLAGAPLPTATRVGQAARAAIAASPEVKSELEKILMEETPYWRDAVARILVALKGNK